MTDPKREDAIVRELQRMNQLLYWLVVASPKGTEFLQEEARRSDQQRQKR